MPANTTDLVALIVKNTSLSGTLPSIKPSYFVASTTRVSGHLPPVLNTVQQVIVDRAKLSGSIPDSIASSTSLRGFQANAMTLSGSIPQGPYSTIQTFSATRNYLTGSTRSLSGAVALKTLILSSNRFSCDSARLDVATGLGQGQFHDPTALALYAFGQLQKNEVNTVLNVGMQPYLRAALGSNFEWVSNPYSNQTIEISNVVSFCYQTAEWCDVSGRWLYLVEIRSSPIQGVTSQRLQPRGCWSRMS